MHTHTHYFFSPLPSNPPRFLCTVKVPNLLLMKANFWWASRVLSWFLFRSWGAFDLPECIWSFVAPVFGGKRITAYCPLGVPLMQDECQGGCWLHLLLGLCFVFRLIDSDSSFYQQKARTKNIHSFVIKHMMKNAALFMLWSVSGKLNYFPWMRAERCRRHEADTIKRAEWQTCITRWSEVTRHSWKCKLTVEEVVAIVINSNGRHL